MTSPCTDEASCGCQFADSVAIAMDKHCNMYTKLYDGYASVFQWSFIHKMGVSLFQIPTQLYLMELGVVKHPMNVTE